MRSLFKTSLIASLCCAAIALANRPLAAQSPYLRRLRLRLGLRCDL